MICKNCGSELAGSPASCPDCGADPGKDISSLPGKGKPLDITTRDFQLTKKQVFRILGLQYLRKRWFTLIISLALTVAFLITSDSIIEYVFIGILAFMLLLDFLKILISTSSKKYLDLYKGVHLVINDEFIRITNDVNSSEVQWQKVVEIKSDPDLYLIFTDRNSFIPVPKSAFKSDTDLKEFEGFVEEFNRALKEKVLI